MCHTNHSTNGIYDESDSSTRHTACTQSMTSLTRHNGTQGVKRAVWRLSSTKKTRSENMVFRAHPFAVREVMKDHSIACGINGSYSRILEAANDVHSLAWPVSLIHRVAHAQSQKNVIKWTCSSSNSSMAAMFTHMAGMSVNNTFFL